MGKDSKQQGLPQRRRTIATVELVDVTGTAQRSRGYCR
jgi:hypothetical protein